jgi:Type IV secretion system pilin
MQRASVSVLLLVPLLAIVIGFALPETASAQFVTCSGTDCSACNIVEMVNKGVVALFGVVGLVFAIIMMKAGFGLVTSGGNTAALNAAKSAFQNALIGLIIVMAAWLIVDLLMRTLLKGDGDLGAAGFTGWGPWSSVQCVPQSITHPWSRSGKDTVDPAVITPPATPPATPAAPGTYTHAEAVAALGGGFTISSSGNCSDKTKASCTSLDGIQKNAIQRVKELKALVGTSFIITGGTEVGHAGGTYSHANGYKIDLRVDTKLNDYITTNFTSIGGSKWKDANGNIYYRHGPPDHWDITYRY